MSISFKSSSQFESSLKSLEEKLKSGMETAAKQIAVEGEQNVKNNLYAGHGVDTGNLKSSYHGEVTKEGSSHKVKVSTDCDYAPCVEYRWGGKISHFRPGIDKTERDAPEIIRRNVKL